MNYAHFTTSQYTRRTGQSLICATHRILKPNSQLPKFIKTITIAPAIFNAARTNPAVLVKFLRFCEMLCTIKWWSNSMQLEIQAFLRDRTGIIQLEMFLFQTPNMVQNIEPFPAYFRPRLEGTVGSRGHVQFGSHWDVITTLPRIKSITDSPWHIDDANPPDEFDLKKGDKVGLVEELKFVSLSGSTMLQMGRARTWDNLRTLHTSNSNILRNLDNVVPVLETFVLYQEADYYVPDGDNWSAYSRTNQCLQMFRAPSLTSIAL